MRQLYGVLRAAAIDLLVGLAYLLAAQLGLTFAYVSGNVTTMWPAAGVGLAAVVLGGPRRAIPVAVAGLVANVSTGAPPLAWPFVAAANATEALLGLLLLRAAAFDPRLRRLRDVAALAAAAALAAPVATLVGTAGLWLSGAARDVPVWRVLAVWWIGDVTGIVVAAPLVLTWLSRQRGPSPPARVVELALVLSASIVVSVLVFRTPFPLSSAVFPLLLWAALRLGPRGVSATIAAITLIATSYTGRDAGPFAAWSLHVNLAILDGFLLMTALTGLLLAAALQQVAESEAERTRLTHEAEASRDREALREQLLGVLSHDLRNPLQAVQMASAAMRRASDDPALCARLLERIESSAARMGKLIAAVLDFTESRLGGGIRVTPALTDLAAVSRAVVGELEVAHPGRELTVVGGGPLWGYWDPARLGQVVSNLVGNALKHSSGAVTVTLRADDDAVECAVHNAGTIPAELLPEIFEPFRRGAGPARGLGLGLFIVRQIVAAHGGTVTVRSSDAAGTTFTVRLPRGLEAAPAELPAPL